MWSWGSGLPAGVAFALALLESSALSQLQWQSSELGGPEIVNRSLGRAEGEKPTQIDPAKSYQVT